MLFYSLAQWDNHWVSTVGYAVSDSPEGPFEVRGKVFFSEKIQGKIFGKNHVIVERDIPPGFGPGLGSPVPQISTPYPLTYLEKESCNSLYSKYIDNV